MAVREWFVPGKGIIHVIVTREYYGRRTAEDLFEVQQYEDVKNDYCERRHGNTVQFSHRFCTKFQAAKNTIWDNNKMGVK